MNKPVAIGVQAEVITDRPPLITPRWYSWMREAALGLFKSSASSSALKETVVFTYSSCGGRNAVSELTAASSWVSSECPPPTLLDSRSPASTDTRKYMTPYSYVNTN